MGKENMIVGSSCSIIDHYVTMRIFAICRTSIKEMYGKPVYVIVFYNRKTKLCHIFCYIIIRFQSTYIWEVKKYELLYGHGMIFPPRSLQT